MSKRDNRLNRQDLTAMMAAMGMAFALSGCGPSEEQIRKDERAKIAAENAARQKVAVAAQPAASLTETSDVQPPAAPERETWPGRYDLTAPGSEGDVEIAPIKGSTQRFNVSFDVGAAGCGGQVRGTAVETKAGALSFTADPDEFPAQGSDPLCKIDLRRAGRNGPITVSEDYQGCTIWHGAACSFDGTMRRSK